MYHPKVDTKKKKKNHQSKIELQERFKIERERERIITFSRRKCETNNKIIEKKMSRRILKKKLIVENTKLSKSYYVIE